MLAQLLADAGQAIGPQGLAVDGRIGLDDTVVHRDQRVGAHGLVGPVAEMDLIIEPEFLHRCLLCGYCRTRHDGSSNGLLL